MQAQGTQTSWRAWGRRWFATLVILFVWLPAADASAMGETLHQLWHGEEISVGVCSSVHIAMTPDLRASTLDAPQPATVAPPPCEEDATNKAVDDSELCSKLPEGMDVTGDVEARPAAPLPERPAFVAASLKEDILPLEPEDPYMCSASSENPDTCESHPPLPQLLTLEVSTTGALVRLEEVVRHPPERAQTLPLPHVRPRSLLGPAAGHARGLDPPPRASHSII